MTLLRKFGSWPNAAAALMGYRVFALGYLIKPFLQSELDAYVARAVKCLGSASEKPLFVAKAGQTYVPITKSNLGFAESEMKCIYLHLSDGTVPKITMSIDNLLKELDSEFFCKTHKSFIANLSYITGVTPYEFSLGSFGSAAITQRNYPKVKRGYLEYLRNKEL